MLKAVLIRIGIDHSYGQWNAPADPESGEFIYVPIPESSKGFHPECERRYNEFIPVLEQFSKKYGLDLDRDLDFPRKNLLNQAIHLDPDFEYLTYGDDGGNRGSVLRTLSEGDLLVFYAGMRSINPKDKQLIYGIIGILVIDHWREIHQVEEKQWRENAHTRKTKRGPDDIVVWGKPGVSGRLSRFLPIGELRNKAYRVRLDLLEAWGDLSVKDGFIQRSVRPPTFKNPERFYEWFNNQEFSLIASNHDTE